MTDRELDALVAEKVMGCKLKQHPMDYPVTKYTILCGCYDGRHEFQDAVSTQLKFYSTDIAASWTIVEKMTQNNYHFCIHKYFGNQQYTAEFHLHELDIVGTHAGRDSSNPARAICLAALKACGVDVQSNHAKEQA